MHICKKCSWYTSSVSRSGLSIVNCMRAFFTRGKSSKGCTILYACSRKRSDSTYKIKDAYLVLTMERSNLCLHILLYWSFLCAMIVQLLLTVPSIAMRPEPSCENTFSFRGVGPISIRYSDGTSSSMVIGLTFRRPWVVYATLIYYNHYSSAYLSSSISTSSIQLNGS